MPFRRAVLVGCAVLLLGCMPPELAEDGIVNFEDPLTSANGLTSSGLTTNGITSNGLTSNRLTGSGLATKDLAHNTVLLRALRDRTSMGSDARLLFRYLVSCALPATSRVQYTWRDASGLLVTEVVSGSLGLAPGWETGPLDEAGQEWVTACLAARTNATGINVPVSIRGNRTGALQVGSAERAEYAYGEGSFWGNLFAGTPWVSSCSRSPLRRGAMTSQDLWRGRTCASGSHCGIIKYAGPCYLADDTTRGQACTRRDMINGDWSDGCAADSTASATSDRVLTTWLRP